MNAAEPVINKSPLSRIDRFLLILTLEMIIFPGWIQGGTGQLFRSPHFQLALGIFIVFLVLPYWDIVNSSPARFIGIKKQLKEIFTDILFYLGGLFLCLLFVQWLNSENVFVMVFSGGKGVHGTSNIDRLSGVVDSSVRWDMVEWYFPAFVVLLIVRRRFSSPQMVKPLFWGMSVNASLLSVFGCVAPILVKQSPLWLKPILPRQSAYFFSTFNYANQAGSFFLLHLGLACGLFFYYYFTWEQQRRVRLKTGILLGIILVLLYGIHISGVRYPILFSWLMAAVFVVYFLYCSVWKRSDRRWKSIIVTAGIVFALIIGSFGLYLTARGKVLPELSTMSDPKIFIKEQLKWRLWSWEGALKMWTDYPAFGAGGGGFSKNIARYVRIPRRGFICTYHVHNEFLQFLCEFGIIGTGLVLSLFILLLMDIKKYKNGEKIAALVFFSLIGVLGVVIHSVLDIPFRNPSVVIAFIVILAGLGQWKRYSEELETKMDFEIKTSTIKSKSPKGNKNKRLPRGKI